MSIEDRLSESLARHLDRLEVPAGDVGAALRAGERQRRQRTWTTGLAAAAVLAVVATGVALARTDDGGDGRLDPALPTGSWTRLPDPLLSARAGGIAVWTGTEAIFLGGQIDHLCPPNADCADRPTYARDGAAYDPVSQTWRTIAPSPVPVAAHTPHAIVGDNLVLTGDNGSWHAYDVSDDEWRSLPAPPTELPTPLDISTPLTTGDGRVYTLGKGAVLALDPATDTWSALPPSPHRPRIDAQTVVATPEGVALFGVDATALNDGTVPSYLMAEVYDGTSWRRLERSDILGGWGGWHWTGKRLISPYAECMDGGDTNPYPSCIPTGGALDVSTGTWSPLTPAGTTRGGWSLSAAAGTRVATWGHVYDDSTETWTKLPRPEGASDYGAVAVWADGTLIAFGGVSWREDAAYARLSSHAWAWAP